MDVVECDRDTIGGSVSLRSEILVGDCREVIGLPLASGAPE